jgi:predicted small metal-binding protein
VVQAPLAGPPRPSLARAFQRAAASSRRDIGRHIVLGQYSFGLGSDPVGEVRNALQVLVLRCECGVESRGDADELVRLVQQHALSVHNMAATREQILERARPA